MKDIGSLTVNVDVDTHGGLGNGTTGVIRRTIGLWLIAMAQTVLRSRIDVTFTTETRT